MTNTDKLDLLNNFRVAEGKAPFADWRKARHQPMLDAYFAVERATAEAFEHRQRWLAARTERVRTSNEQTIDTSDESDTAPVPAPVAETPKLPSYKEMLRDAKTSAIDKPVAYVHAFCDAHPEMTRKQVTSALVAAGVNFSTARTQYQRWYAAHKAK